MKSPTPTRRWPQLRPVPMALGAFFAFVTAAILFDDVRHGAEVTTSHLLSLAALVAAIASGHLAIPQIRAGAIVSGLMLSVLFLGATSYIVIASGARNAEQAAHKAAASADINERRAHEQKKLAEAETMLSHATERLRDDCVRGKKSKGHCDGIRATIAVYSAAVKGHKVTLAELGPAQQASAGYAHAARVLAAIPGVTEPAEAIQARLELLLPFITVLISELGTIAFLHIGIGHRAPAKVPAQSAPAVPSEKPKGPTGSGPNKPRRTVRKQVLRTVGLSGGTVVPFSRERAKADIVARLGRSEVIPSQDDLAAAWNRPKSTVSGWLIMWEADGTIPARVAEGRRKTLGGNVTPLRLSA